MFYDFILFRFWLVVTLPLFIELMKPYNFNRNVGTKSINFWRIILINKP